MLTYIITSIVASLIWVGIFFGVRFYTKMINDNKKREAAKKAAANKIRKERDAALAKINRIRKEAEEEVEFAKTQAKVASERAEAVVKVAERSESRVAKENDNLRVRNERLNTRKLVPETERVEVALEQVATAGWGLTKLLASKGADLVKKGADKVNQKLEERKRNQELRNVGKPA
jgi:hypothetical protein